MFPVSEQSAEKVQSDINTLLDAFARFLDKIHLHATPASKPLPPVEMDAWLAEEEPFIDLEVIPDRPALPGRKQELLEGRDPFLVAGRPTPPSSEGGAEAEVRLQIGDTYIIALLPDVKPQLEQLSPEQLATLAGAIASSHFETDDVLEAEIIDIQINGVQCFHQEQGQVTVNVLLPTEARTQNLSQPQLQQDNEAVVEQVQDIIQVTEIEEQPTELPTVELRPAHEVEAISGQELGDSSTLHNQVLHDAASVRVMRDQYGQIEGGTAVREAVEATEDAVEAEVEYQAEHQPLTAEAREVVRALHDYFDRTGERRIAGDNDYQIERLDSDYLRFTPYENSAEAVTIQGNQLESEVSTNRYTHLMLRFASAYESLQVLEQESNLTYSELERAQD